MLDTLEELYRHFIRSDDDPGPYYAVALRQWKQALAEGDELDLQDAMEQLRYNWGVHAFTVGLDLGLSLSREL